MPVVSFVQPNGDRESIEVDAGLSVMQGATMHGIDGIAAECGGNAMCATCHVYVESHHDVIPPMQEDEDALLGGTSSERRDNSRLSCQLVVTSDLDGLVVRIPEVIL